MKSPNGFIFFWIKLTPNIPCPCLLVSSAACRPNERHPRLHGSGGPAPNALSMDVYTWFSKTGGPTKPTKVLYFDVDGLFFSISLGFPHFWEASNSAELRMLSLLFQLTKIQTAGRVNWLCHLRLLFDFRAWLRFCKSQISCLTQKWGMNVSWTERVRVHSCSNINKLN
jgi:hypothetical protein